MTVRSILIVGGSGFLGTHLALKLREGYKVFATYHKRQNSIPGVSFLPMDLEKRDWVRRVIYMTQPNVIIYAAGPENREWAERNVRNAEKLHTEGPTTIASSTDIMQPRFIYLSNSYVFDASRGNYHETDTILPGNALGRAKSGGENAMKSKSLNYIILRSSPLYGRGNGLNLSFLDKVRMRLDRKQRIEMNNNELHSFAPVEGLVDTISRLLGSGVRNRILHYGGLTKVTYFQLGRKFAKYFGYDENLIVAKNSKTDTVYDFSLNSTQTIETLKIKPFLLEEGFDLIQKNLVARS